MLVQVPVILLALVLVFVVVVLQLEKGREPWRAYCRGHCHCCCFWHSRARTPVFAHTGVMRQHAIKHRVTLGTKTDTTKLKPATLKGLPGSVAAEC